MKAFIVDSKNLFNKKKNPKLSLGAEELLRNKKIEKKHLTQDSYRIRQGIDRFMKEDTKQGLLEELTSDVYGYDLRNWDERGITEETIKERYENCKKSDFPLVSASRFFSYVLPRLRSVYNTDVEKVVDIMMASREKNWKELRKDWLNSLKRVLKIYFEDPEEPNRDYLKSCYEEYVRYCEILNEKPLSKRKIYDSVKKIV